LIPKEALIDDNKVILNRNDFATYKDVEIGIRSKTHYEVLTGLNEGDHVIIEGNIGLEEGYPIQEIRKGSYL